MLAPTPHDLLVDPQGRPYFLWDMEMTLEEFEQALRNADPITPAADLRAVRIPPVDVVPLDRKRMAPARCAGRVLRLASRQPDLLARRIPRMGGDAQAPRRSLDAPRNRHPLPHHQPANETTYLIDPTLHREFQSLHLRATHDAK